MRTLLLLMLLIDLLLAGEPPGLVKPGAVIEEIGRGYGFTEGPAVGEEGQVYFTDIPNNRIMLWQPDGTISTWREDSGGANGLFVHAGQVYACLGDRRQVVAIASDGTINPLSFQGGHKRLNSPNDLWVDAQGGVYFTDPRYGSREGMEQDGEHVWYIAPGVANAQVAARDFTRPNGIVGTPDGRRLYIADHQGATVWQFTIAAPGRLADRMKFCDEGSDGMCLDGRGNLYLTWKRAIRIYAPDGTRLAVIPTPIEPTNVCFGGPARSTLFITGGTTLHRLAMLARGVE